MRPDVSEREEMNRVIMEELVYGVFRPEALEFFQRVIGQMREAAATASC